MSTVLRKGIRALIRTTGAGDNPPAGQRALIAKSDGWYDRDETGVETNLNLSGGGGGGLTLTVVEINAGTIARDTFYATVANAAVTVNSKIISGQSGIAATGKQADENEMETFGVVAIPLAGSIKFALNAYAGSRLQGNVKVHYAIG